MAFLGFNPGTYTVLRNGLPAPWDRFAEWNADTQLVGDRATPLASGQATVWQFRTDRRHSFALPFLSPRIHFGGESTLSIAHRLVASLRAGAFVDVGVEDEAGAPTVTGFLAEGADASIELADPAAGFYTLRVTVTLPSLVLPVYGGVSL